MNSHKLRQRLDQQVNQGRREILSLIPSDVRISIAVDCWQSPNKLSFMAVTGYFIDANWKYHEVLLGFEHIKGKHDGQNLAAILLNVLSNASIDKQRLLTITADNASVNGRLVDYLQECCKIVNAEIGIDHITHAPCLAHVIQLAVNELILKIRINPRNDTITTTWSNSPEDREKHSYANDEDERCGGVPWTLKKVALIVIIL
jgi:hypothetical protein